MFYVLIETIEFYFKFYYNQYFQIIYYFNIK